MKLLTTKVNETLKNRRGETLVEAIISILLLAILLTTITTMINTSRTMTANAMREAELVQQGAFNPVFLTEYDINNNGESIEVEFGITIGTSIYIETSQSSVLYAGEGGNSNIIAFYPAPEGD